MSELNYIEACVEAQEVLDVRPYSYPEVESGRDLSERLGMSLDELSVYFTCSAKDKALALIVELHILRDKNKRLLEDNEVLSYS